MSTRRSFVATSLLAGASLAFSSGCGLMRRSAAASSGDAVRRFRAKLGGRVILPSDGRYESARRVQSRNAQSDKFPALLVQCASADDVARSIEFAQREQLPLAVRSGGHSYLGWGTGEGLVLDVSHMKGFAFDRVKRTLRVGAGATAAEILAHAAKRGMAPVLGQCGSVGAGLALGGGLGWLSGTHGAVCDNVVSARLVTADATEIAADSKTNADLFWAIRGGGGNFGVATSLGYQLHPVREVLAGGLTYPFSEARDVFRFFRDFMSTAPDELQALAAAFSAGAGSALVVLVFNGDLDRGEQLVDEFRKFKRPAKDWVARRAYVDTYTMPPYGDGDGDEDSDGGDSCEFNAIRGSYLEKLSDQAIDTVMARFPEAPRACDVWFDFDHYTHGEMCRVAPDATAFELRDPGAVHLAYGMHWDERTHAQAGEWLDETWKQLQPFSGGRMYTNYMSVAGDAAARAAYGRNYARLASIKKRYDPGNLFKGNLNIRPS